MTKSKVSFSEADRLDVIKHKCERDGLFFARYFAKARWGIKWRMNWHHALVSDELEKVASGETPNLILNICPGSSKTELAVINFMARQMAINSRCRFLHISYSDDLALLNSQASRDLITSDEYQQLWPLAIADDAKAKKRWNVVGEDGKKLGGVYAVSLGGQITGFRAGHMTDGFQGSIILDDPLKPEDARSKPKRDEANRKLVSTVRNRRATPQTPIVLIMQRVGEEDPTGFIREGKLGGEWKVVTIPALIDDAYVAGLAPKYSAMIEPSERDEKGRFSYWPYKEPLSELVEMERKNFAVFSAQYQQQPTPIGGDLIKGEWFKRFKMLPRLDYRMIFADTAQKTAERNDFSVFQCWGMGPGGIYLVDMIRGKWEAHELKRRAIDFWNKCNAADVIEFGSLRAMKVEDKSSGTGLIQDIRSDGRIPVLGIERNRDKYTRVMDAQPYIESGRVWLPEDAQFVSDFINECEAFTADDTHKHDDQIDPLCDAVADMLARNGAPQVAVFLSKRHR